VARSAPFEIFPLGQPAGAAPVGIVGPDEERRMDQMMADLAAAFALDHDLVNTLERQDGEKWPPGRTILFVVLSSAALWALIAGLITLI
jgi:hypothetical protein